jgi:hypothetical protein
MHPEGPIRDLDTAERRLHANCGHTTAGRGCLPAPPRRWHGLASTDTNQCTSLLKCASSHPQIGLPPSSPASGFSPHRPSKDTPHHHDTQTEPSPHDPRRSFKDPLIHPSGPPTTEDAAVVAAQRRGKAAADLCSGSLRPPAVRPQPCHRDRLCDQNIITGRPRKTKEIEQKRNQRDRNNS